MKDYFQEWLDINELQRFRQIFSKQSNIKTDWLSLSGVAYQMKFFSLQSVALLCKYVEEKWILTTSDRYTGKLANKNFKAFKKFKHTHPLILQLLDFVAKLSNPGPAENHEQDKEIIMKYAKLIQIFGFNTINLLLIDRVKAAHIFMNCLMNYTQYIEEKDLQAWQKEDDFILQMLHCAAICLRLKRSILAFLKDKQAYFPFLLKLMRSQVRNTKL